VARDLLARNNSEITTDHIFSTRTPTPFDGDPRPKKISGKIASRFLSGLVGRIKPLMKVRDAMDKIYAKGYHEQHYRGADKELKKLLHEEALVAHAKMRDQEVEEEDDAEDEHESRPLVVNIHIGKG